MYTILSASPTVRQALQRFETGMPLAELWPDKVMLGIGHVPPTDLYEFERFWNVWGDFHVASFS